MGLSQCELLSIQHQAGTLGECETTIPATGVRSVQEITADNRERVNGGYLMSLRYAREKENIR